MMTKDLVDRVLQGDPAARKALVLVVSRVFQREAALLLFRYRRQGAGRDIRQELADTVQNLFVALFEGGAKALRAWDPEKGRSLEVFLAVFARHQILSALRNKRRTPWVDLPTAVEDLSNLLVSEPDLPALHDDQELLRRLLAAMQEDLNSADLDLFRRLYWELQTVEEICAETGLTPQVLYKRKSRLRERVTEIRDRLLGKPPETAN